MIDSKTREFIQRTVKENFTPGNINVALRALEDQLEEAQGDKKIVCEAFILGIRQVLGRVS